jgi:hypothetical protein
MGARALSFWELRSGWLGCVAVDASAGTQQGGGTRIGGLTGQTTWHVSGLEGYPPAELSGRQRRTRLRRVLPDMSDQTARK